jgi:hypothetical protein
MKNVNRGKLLDRLSQDLVLLSDKVTVYHCNGQTDALQAFCQDQGIDYEEFVSDFREKFPGASLCDCNVFAAYANLRTVFVIHAKMKDGSNRIGPRGDKGPTFSEPKTQIAKL